MDLIQCIYKLRPDVTWFNSIVNGYSLETISSTYQSSEDIPTEPECEAIWLVIEAENLMEDQRIEDIQDEKEAVGVSKFTVAEAKAKVDERMTLVTDLDSLKVQCTWLFKKIIVYLLK